MPKMRQFMGEGDGTMFAELSIEADRLDLLTIPILVEKQGRCGKVILLSPHRVLYALDTANFREHVVDTLNLLDLRFDSLDLPKYRGILLCESA